MKIPQTLYTTCYQCGADCGNPFALLHHSKNECPHRDQFNKDLEEARERQSKLWADEEEIIPEKFMFSELYKEQEDENKQALSQSNLQIPASSPSALSSALVQDQPPHPAAQALNLQPNVDSLKATPQQPVAPFSSSLQQKSLASPQPRTIVAAIQEMIGNPDQVDLPTGSQAIPWVNTVIRALLSIPQLSQLLLGTAERLQSSSSSLKDATTLEQLVGSLAQKDSSALHLSLSTIFGQANDTPWDILMEFLRSSRPQPIDFQIGRAKKEAKSVSGLVIVNLGERTPIKAIDFLVKHQGKEHLLVGLLGFQLLQQEVGAFFSKTLSGWRSLGDEIGPGIVESKDDFILKQFEAEVLIYAPAAYLLQFIERDRLRASESSSNQMVTPSQPTPSSGSSGQASTNPGFILKYNCIQCKKYKESLSSSKKCFECKDYLKTKEASRVASTGESMAQAHGPGARLNSVAKMRPMKLRWLYPLFQAFSCIKNLNELKKNSQKCSEGTTSIDSFMLTWIAELGSTKPPSMAELKSALENCEVDEYSVEYLMVLFLQNLTDLHWAMSKDQVFMPLNSSKHLFQIDCKAVASSLQAGSPPSIFSIFRGNARECTSQRAWEPAVLQFSLQGCAKYAITCLPFFPNEFSLSQLLAPQLAKMDDPNYVLEGLLCESRAGSTAFVHFESPACNFIYEEGKQGVMIAPEDKAVILERFGLTPRLLLYSRAGAQTTGLPSLQQVKNNPEAYGRSWQPKEDQQAQAFELEQWVEEADFEQVNLQEVLILLGDKNELEYVEDQSGEIRPMLRCKSCQAFSIRFNDPKQKCKECSRCSGTQFLQNLISKCSDYFNDLGNLQLN